MATEGQEHPIGVYLKIWILLFVLSVFSYMVDFYQLQGLLRWSLILIFMFLKAGFIMAIFYAYGLGKDGVSGSTFIPYDSCLSFYSHNGV